MLKYYTHTDNVNVFKRIVMRLSFVVFITLLSNNIFSQTYQYTSGCAGGIHRTETILDATGISASAGGYDGYWITPDGSMSNGDLAVEAPYDEFSIIRQTDFAVGTKVYNYSNITWHSNVSGQNYNIHLKFDTGATGYAPIVIDFYTNTPEVCADSYNAIVFLTIEGGHNYYDVTITDGAGDVVLVLGSLNTDILDYPVDLGVYLKVDGVQTFYVNAVTDNQCEADVSIVSPVIFTPVPGAITPYDISILEPTPYCSGYQYTVHLDGIDAGVTYQLLDPNNNVIATLDGDGGSQDFTSTGLPSGGTYRVVAIDDATGCSVYMNNDLVIQRTPDVTNITMTASNTCDNAATIIGLTNSEVDVNYSLWFDDGSGVPVKISDRDGNGGAISIVNQMLNAGTYTVLANNNGCTALVSNSITIYATPNSYSITTVEGEPYCAGNQYTVRLADTDPGVVYRLLDPGNNPLGTLTGDGNPRNFSSIVLSTSGTYRVLATNGTCTAYMLNDIEMHSVPDVSGINMTITNTCDNATTTIGIDNSESDVYYSLWLDVGTANEQKVSNTLVGNGGPISLVTNQLLDAGSYTVQAENRYDVSYGCVVWVSDEVTIYEAPDDVFTTSSVICGTGAITINTAESDVNYTLLIDGSADLASYPAVVPSGNLVSWTGLTATGLNTVYTVQAERNGCITTMSGQLVVEGTPDDKNVYEDADTYCIGQADVNIVIENTDVDVIYALIDASGTDVATLTGNGIDRSFNGVTEGIYSVEARSSLNASACVRVLETGIDITEVALPNVSLTGIRLDYCEDEGSVNLVGSPTNASGVWAGPGSILTDNKDGTATINPGVAGAAGSTYNLVYTYTDVNGCIASDDIDVTIHPNTINDNLSFTGLGASYCATSADVTITAVYTGIGFDTDYTGFSGDGINDNNDGTATFSPANAGLGTHTITINYRDPNTNCEGSYSQVVQVGVPLSIQNIADQYCANDDTDYDLVGLVNGVLPVFDNSYFDIYDPEANKIIGNITNNTDGFNPAQIVAANSGKTGDYKLVYNYNDGTCDNTVTQVVELVEIPNATFSFPDDDNGDEQNKFCYNYGDVKLTSNDPDIADYTERYYLNGTLIPGQFNTIGNGSILNYNALNTIHHEVDNGICTTASTRTFSIRKLDEQIYTICDEYFENSGSFDIRSLELDQTKAVASFTAEASNGDISWLVDHGDNTATIDPDGHIGYGYKVIMIYEDKEDGCEEVVEEEFNINEPMKINGVFDGQQICQGSSVITLQGAPLLTGGTGSFTESTGITNTGNNGEAELNPSMMSIGEHTIEFQFVGTGGCTHSFSLKIEIVQAPIDIYKVKVDNGGIFCKDDPGVRIGLTGSTTGVVYELIYNNASFSSPIIFNGDGADFWFENAGIEILFDKEGEYTVRAISSSCTADMSGSAILDEYELHLQLASPQKNVSCNGGKDGSVTLTTTGGSGNYAYSIYSYNGVVVASPVWQNSSSTIIGLEEGTYEFSVKDENVGCEALGILSVEITQPSSITITEIENISVGCAGCSVVGGTCEGSATISISGGTPDYGKYPNVGYGVLWSNGDTDLTATNLPEGTHSVTVTDGNGCTQNLGVSILTITPALSLNENIADHVDNVCYNNADGLYIVTATGGSGTYEFTTTDPTDPTAVWVPGNVTPDQYRVQGLEDGTYLVWVRDANPIYSRCYTQVTTPIVILEPAALSLVEDSQIGITCSGNTDGSFIVRASGGESTDYEFSEVNPSVAVAADWKPESGVDTYELTGKGAGTYRVWVRDAVYPGCGTSFVDVTLSDIVPFAFVVDEHKDVSCNSYNDGKLEVTAQGGSGNYVYQWEYPDGSIVNSNFIETLFAGDYNLTIIDNGPLSTCADLVQTFTITQPDVLTIQNENIFSADCENTGSIQLEILGGTPPYTINWSDGTNQVLANPGIISVSGLAPGNYTIDITDSKLCNFNNVGSEFVVGQNNPITLLLPATVINNSCNGGISGSIYVQVEGGSGDYQFRLEGPVIRDWSNSTSATMDDFTFAGLVEGNYDVKVRDANNINCVYTVGSYTLVDPAPLGLVTNSISDVTCFGDNDGSFTVTASGGSGTYQFNVDNTGYNTGDNPALFTKDLLLAGDHTVWVRDSKATGCQYQLHPVIKIDPVGVLGLSIDSYQDVSCHDGQDGEVVLVAAGGSGDYDFSKDGGATWDVVTSNTVTYDKLFDGTYDFRVRDHNSLSCAPVSVIHDVVEPLAFITNATPTDVLCTGEATGQIVLTTTYSDFSAGAFTYSIDGGNTWLASPITGLAAGTYSIDVKDESTGCIINNAIPAGVTINQPTSSIAIGNEVITNVSCYDGANGIIDLQGNVTDGTVAAGSDYYYTWYKKGTPDLIQNQGFGLDKITGLSEGTYFVVVKDDNQCEETSDEFIVTQPEDWNVDYTPSDLTKYNGADGVIDVHTHTGSNPGHSIKWYTVVGGVEAAMSPLYDNVWTVNTLQAGTYRFKITDGVLCTYVSDDIVIAQPLEFSVTDPNTNKTNVTCYGGSNGIIKVEIVSGTGDFTLDVTGTLEDGSAYGGFNDTQAASNFELTGLYAGQYNVVVTDIHTGEVLSYVVEISQPNQLTVDLVSSQDITCNGGDDGKIVVEINGATINETSSTISWARNPVGWSVSGIVDDATTDLREQSGLYAGTYTINVLSEKGCYATPLTVTLTEKAAITATEQVTHVTTNGGTNGRIYVNNIVSVDVISSVEWYKKDASGTYIPTGVTGIDNDNLTAGIYQYEITDTESCTFTSDDILVSEPGQALNVDVTSTAINCYGDASGVVTVNITTGVALFAVTLTGTQDDGTMFTAKNSDKSYTEFTDLKAGTYQVTVTDDEGQSYTENDIVISENPQTILTIKPTDIHCYGETSTIELSLTGRTNGSESWQLLDPALGEVYNGPLAGNNIQIVGLEGEYTISVTNQDGCVLTDKVTINEPDELIAEWNPTDATIYGLNNGIIDIHTITGGNGAPYSISWADDASVTDFLRNDLLAGTYTFTIEDNDGCFVTYFDVIGQPNPLNVVVTPKDATCYGYSDGSINVKIAIPNNGGLTYRITGNEDDGDSYDSKVITPTSVNSTVSYLEAGTYTIDAYDSKGTVYHQENIRIDQEAEVTLTGTIKDITCFGDADGRVIVALNGRAPLSTDNISWSGSKGFFDAGSLYDDVAGTYINHEVDPVSIPEEFTVTVTSAQGCEYQNTFDVTEPNEIVIAIDDIQDVTCKKGKDGSIAVNVTGRDGGGYTYAWRKKDATNTYQPYAGAAATLTGLYAGEYQVTVTSITDNCEATYSDIEVLDGSEITINETLTHITSCVGDNNGVITISAEDGISPYTVNVTGQPTQTGDGSAAFVFTGLYAGNYVIEVSDARGVSCATVTKNVTITEPVVAFAVNNTAHDIDCDPANSTSGTFTFDITGGVPVGGNYRYQILLPEASIAKPVTITVGSTYNENINGLDEGTYNLTVLDLNSSDPATCAFKYQFTLEHIVITNDPVVNTTCKGINNGAITGITIEGASANYTYNWTTSDGGIGLDNTTLNQSGLSVGTYLLTITDPDRGACSVSKEFYVDVDNTIVIHPTIKDISCNGGTDGAITLDVSGISASTLYTWTGPGIVDATLKDQLNLTSGNYTVEISSTIDGQTCVADRVYTVAQPNPITYTASYEHTDCDPFERTLKLTGVTGGTGAGTYTYSWDGPAFNPVVPVDPTSVLIYEGGMYTIKVKDANQCEAVKTLSVPNEISINPFVNHVTCNGGNTGSIVLNVAGGTGQYTFNWTYPDASISTVRNIDELYAGEYTVVITDENESDAVGNCFREFTIVIEEPDPIVIDPTVEHTSCFGTSDGKIEIEVSGGNAPYIYSWSPVVGSNLSTNRNQYNLPADTYTVTVIDASAKGGCSATENIVVQQDPKIVLSTVVTETICDGTGGAIDLMVTGGSGSGFKYDWSSALGSGLVQGDQNQSGLTGGTFTVDVSDLGDGRSCKATISETLTHAISVINESVSPVTCSGNDDGTISYDVIGGDGIYTYTWNVISGDPTRIVPGSRNQSGLSEGVYEVTITDGRSDNSGTDCAIKKTFTVTASKGLVVNVAVEDSKMCFGEPGGKLVASVTGGSGNYKYIWNGVEGTSVLDDLVQGIYGLEVVDNILGCNYIQSYEIKGPAAPLTIDNIVVTDVLCFNQSTGSIDVTISGGTIPSNGYIYTWTGGASPAVGSNPGNLFAGTYNLTVTDDNGCTVESVPIVVDQPSSYIKVDNSQITDVTVTGGTNGQILVDIYDGVAPRSVEWFDAADVSKGTLNPVTGLSAGTYRVVATDANGCPAELTGLRVVEPGEVLGFETTVHQISPCNGADNGEIHINRIYGGYPIDGNHYDIQIIGPGTPVNTTGTSYDMTGLAPGTYIVTVTDDVSVTYQEQIEIKEYPSLSLNTNKMSDVDCYGGSNGAIQVEVSGGKADASNNYLVEITSAEGYYHYKDDVVANTVFTFSNLPAGNYTVRLIDHAEDFDTKVPDRGNCELSEFTLITEPSAVVELQSVSGSKEICAGDSYEFSIETTNWNFIDGNLVVTVYDDFEYKEYLVTESPLVFIAKPATSRTYKITKVHKSGDATCLQGETTGNQVQLTVHELPTANITGPAEVCEDGTVQLSVNFTGTSPFSLTWKDDNNGTSNTISDITTNSYTFTDAPVADASYIILGVSDDYGCSNAGNGQVDVTINNKPTVTLTGSTDICVGEDTDLTIGFNENIAPYTITYKANGVEGTLVLNPGAGLVYSWNVAPDSVTTKYSITSVVDAKGCSMDITVPIEATVIVNPLPKLLSAINSVKDDGGICQGITGVDYSVDAVSNATGYQWSVGTGMNIITGDGTTDVVVDFDRDFTGGYIRVYAENACGVSPVIERWVNAKLLPGAISAPTGDQALCESETGIVYRVNPVTNATSYEWSVPAGFLIQGDATGTSIVIDLDPNVPSTEGDIYVRPINDCSNAEPWSDPLTVTVTPLPVAYAGPDDRVCQTTYTLNADPLNTGETGEWVILSGSGQYANRPVDQVSAKAEIYNISQGENKFMWTVTNMATQCSTSDVVIIYNDQVTVNSAASSDKVCDGNVQLFGTPLNSVIDADEAYWTTTGGGFITESTNENTTATDLDPGTNAFTWTIRKGACYSTATVVVINNKPTEAVIYNASDVIIALQDLPCQTDFTSLKGSLPASDEIGYWRIESGSVTIDDANSTNISITNIAKGDHVLSWNILNGDCLSKTMVTIRNNSLNVDAGVDKYSCDGTTTLYGTEIPGDATGQWSVIEGFGNFATGNAATTDVSALTQEGSGRNVFRWTLTRNGCVSVDSVVISNNQPSPAEIAGGNSTIAICEYEYDLHAVSPDYGIGFWSVVGGQGRFDNPADPNTKVSNIAHGDNIYRWTVTNNTCSSSVEFTVTNLHVEAYAGADTAVCGKIAQLNATPDLLGRESYWTLVDNAGQGIFNPSNTDPKAIVNSLGSGINRLVWTIKQGECISTDTVNIVNNQPYEVSASSYVYTDGNNATLRAEIPELGLGVWSLIEGRGNILNPNSATTNVTNLLPNYNYFRWTVSNVNCTDFVDVAVQSGVLAEADAGLDQLNLCEDYTSLQANDPEGTYGEWSIDEGNATFGNANSAKTTITNIRPGINVFRWTLRFAGGSSNFKTDTVIIINNKPSAANAGIDIIECGESTILNAREPVYGSPTWTVLSGGGVFVDIHDAKSEVNELAKGENIFKYEIRNNECFSYDTVSVFNYEPSDAYAGEDLVVCADSAELNPEIPKYGVGAWRVLKGAGKGKDEDGNETNEIGGGYVYELAPGENILIWEVSIPGADPKCIKSDSITIINNEPSISFAGHNRSVCTDTVSLSGSLPVYGLGTWTLISGSGVIADSSKTNTLVTGLGKGKSRFRWTIDNEGCTSVSDVEIANDLIEAFGGYDQINCSDSAFLEGNNPSPGIGTWGVSGGSGSANFNDNESQYTQVHKLDKGDNILTWTINYKGCQSVSKVKITNNEPSTAFAGDNKATCTNSIMLGASRPTVGTGLWTIRTGGGQFMDDLSESSRVDSLKFGDNVFRWTVEHNDCVSYDDVQISFNKIDAKVGGTQEICSDRTFLEANSPLPGVGTWSVIGGTSQAKFVGINDPVSEVYDLAKGINALRWSINNKGCITYAEVNVVNHSPSTAYAGNTQELCADYTTLDATSAFIGTGKWEVLTGAAIIPLSEEGESKANITGLSKGDNVFRWTITSDNGLCTSIDDVLVINNEPSEPYAGKDEEYCSPTVVLKAVRPDFGTGNWSIIDGGGNFNDPLLPNATISNLNEGVNTLRWTITQGQCSKASDIVITNNTPTTANAGPDIEDCKDFAFLDANASSQGEGYWTLISGNATFVDDKEAKTKVEELTFGKNVLMWNIQKGSCVSSDMINIFNQVPSQAEAGTDKKTCEDYLTLNAGNPDWGKGKWTVISGNGEFDDDTIPTTIVRNLGLGENRFKWTVAYGECTTEDVVEVISNKAAPYAGEDDISYESSYELKASNPGDLGAQWVVVAGNGSFNDNTFFNTIVGDLNEGVNTFRWQMDVDGCITYDDVSIEYRVVPDAGFIVDTAQGCYPLTIQFTNYSTGGSVYNWSFDDGQSSTERNPVHTFVDPGEYMVTLTAPGPDNVDGQFQKVITVHDHPIAEFSYGPDIVYVPGDELRCYSLSVDAQKYLWGFGDGNTSTDVNPIHEYNDEGIYSIRLMVESEHGCTDEIIKTDAVEAVLQGFVKFPNAFSPRSDGSVGTSVGGGETNTVFRPLHRDVEEYKLQIFNRWGQLIYESNDIEEGWNGFFNGELSAQAVYVYKAKGRYISGKEFNKAGSVLLVR